MEQSPLNLDLVREMCTSMLLRSPFVKEGDVHGAIDKVARIYPEADTLRDQLFTRLTADFSVFSERPMSLIDQDSYRPWIKDKKSSIAWRFWGRYRQYLQQRMAPQTVNRLDSLTDDILDYLIDPTVPGPWDRRGMVVGQVQSGKTGNFIGLVNKAADAGFRLIVILAGMHDSLRSQTQVRVDQGFLGFNTKTALNFRKANNRIGVGKLEWGLAAHALTTSDLKGDFSKGVAQGAGINIHGSDPVVLVVKKNAGILKNLIVWLAGQGETTPEGKKLIRDVPLLLIDDEADNASVNTSKPGSISRINGYVRALLSLFDRSAYVGYTATPFANIFIKLEEEEIAKGLQVNISDFAYMAGQDLFPRNFIINIPAPSNYIGPAKIFGLPPLTSDDEAEEPLPVVRVVDDYLSFIPEKHRKDDPLPESLPDSLNRAIRCFVLSCAARRARGQVDVHNSMLIHVTRFIRWQDRIAHLVEQELSFVQNQIEMGRPPVFAELEALWQEEFVPVTRQVIDNEIYYRDPDVTETGWSEVRAHLHDAAAKIQVRAVHGDKNVAGLTHSNITPLDYFAAESQNSYLSVIAVGGDKLSRGLTLEGLSVSYYLRASKMYDTLMQMGRWFGYRPGYADLCRLFTSEELIGWYRHITVASEEMRREFDSMFLQRKTPRQYGLKVRTHPGVLKITAANKFRHKRMMQLSYSGQLEQTWEMPLRPPDLQSRNVELVEQLLIELGNPDPNSNPRLKEHCIWAGQNNYGRIADFLRSYQVEARTLDREKIAEYIEASAQKGYVRDWTVVLVNNLSSPRRYTLMPEGEPIEVGVTYRKNVAASKGKEETDHLTTYRISKSQIIDPVHEALDLTDEQFEAALKSTVDDWATKGVDKVPDRPSSKRIKQVRPDHTGLLIIYPLSFRKDTWKGRLDAIGLAVSFPDIDGDEGIEYAVNEQFRPELDYPEEFDADESDDWTD